MSKPLIVDLPYPTTENLAIDCKSAGIISSAYSTQTGEINAVLHYTYQSFIFEKKGYKQFAENISGIATAEMLHFSLLGKTLLSLGAQPVFSQRPPYGYNFYSTKYVCYSQEPLHMLEDGVRSERLAIRGYEKMLKLLTNCDVKNIISRILEDEKLHLKTFEDMLKAFKC